MEWLIVAITIAGGYGALLLLLEWVAWRVQPDMQGCVTLRIDDDGVEVSRRVFGFEHGGRLYVSSNHWFRQWYHAALAHPDLEVLRDGEAEPMVAVPVNGPELAEVAAAYRLGFVVRFMCGFAPRRFLRLDPRSPTLDPESQREAPTHG